MRLLYTILICLVLIPIKLSAYHDYGVKEKTGSQIAINAEIILDDSLKIQMTQLINKPTLLTFVDYNCNSYCPRLIDGIAELITSNSYVLGLDYQVITLNLKPAGDASSYKRRLEIKRNFQNFTGWYFAEADEESIDRITKGVGYSYIDEKNEYIHPVVTVLLTPTGKISQYFYGYYFNYMHFDMGVLNAKNERISTSRIKTLKYCNEKAPEKNPLVKTIIFIAGALIILSALILFLINTLKRN